MYISWHNTDDDKLTKNSSLLITQNGSTTNHDYLETDFPPYFYA